MGWFTDAIGAVAGPVVSGIFGQSSADKQMRFQKDMSNTSHQREVQDLIAAGLNPILSAKYGGASTPQGAAATMPSFESPFVSSAKASRDRAEKDFIIQQGIESRARTGLFEADKLIRAEDLKTASAIALQEDLKARKAQKDYDALYGGPSSTAAEVSDYPSFIRGPMRTVTEFAAEQSKKLPDAWDFTINSAKRVWNKYQDTRKEQSKARDQKIVEGLKKDWPLPKPLSREVTPFEKFIYERKQHGKDIWGTIKHKGYDPSKPKKWYEFR